MSAKLALLTFGFIAAMAATPAEVARFGLNQAFTLQPSSQPFVSLRAGVESYFQSDCNFVMYAFPSAVFGTANLSY